MGRTGAVELSGDRIINAPQDRLYDALHDPVTLRQVIPGCQSLSVGEGRSQVASVVKVGPIRANVSTTVETFNEDRPAGYSLYAIANAGPAGSGAGTAHLALAAVDENTTNIAYHVSVELDGRIADLGQDVLDETARTLINEFFSRLKLLLETPEEGVVAKAMADAAAARGGAQVDERVHVAQEPLPAPAPPPPAPPPPAPAPASRARTPASTRMVFGDTPSGEDTGEASSEFPGGYDDRHEDVLSQPDGWRPGLRDERPGGSAQFPGEARGAPVGRSEGMSGTKRWILVALGLAVIAYLLSGGF